MTHTRLTIIIAVLALIAIRFSHHTIIVANEVEAEMLPAKVASWYDYKFVGNWGQTCNRSKEDCYTEYHLTAASREYPRGSMVEVCRNNKCITVKITDYIEHPDRDIDLSSYAFSQLADLKLGLIKVYTKRIE